MATPEPQPPWEPTRPPNALEKWLWQHRHEITAAGPCVLVLQGGLLAAPVAAGELEAVREHNRVMGEFWRGRKPRARKR